VTGTLLAVAIVFVILVVMTRSITYYRGNFSVAGAESGTEADARHSATVGAGAGLIVLLLLALLYLGVTRWEWFGQPAPKPAVLAAPKAQPSPALGGVGATPVPGAGASPAASPSASPSASPHP
jgi:hypothetical protein